MNAETPLAIGPHTVKPPSVCLGCFYPIHFVRERCSTCNVPLCEKKCEKSPLHQKECKVLSLRKDENIENFEDYDLITPLRVALLKKDDPETFNNQILTLEANREPKRTNINDEAKLTNMVQRLKERYFPDDDDVTREDLETIACIIDTNTYQVLVKTSVEGQNFVCGLYPKAARLNHSCRPNTRPLFDARQRMAVMAIDDIAKGSEITTSYLEPFYTTYQRRSILKRGKHFDCRCPRCSDPTELGSYSSAIRCSACKSGFCLPTKPLNMASDWQCEKCHLYLAMNDSINLDNKLVEELARVDRNKINNLEKFIAAYKPYLHRNHAFLMQLKQWTFENLGKVLQSSNVNRDQDLETWEELIHCIRRKLELGQELLQYFNKVEGKLSFIRGVVLLEMCHTYFKALNVPKSTSMSAPDILERARKSLNEANVIFRNDDPNGPDAGALIAGTKQLSSMLSQL